MRSLITINKVRILIILPVCIFIIPLNAISQTPYYEQYYNTRNPEYHNYPCINCSNFVSQVLRHYDGIDLSEGINDPDGNIPDTDNLRDFLENNEDYGMTTIDPVEDEWPLDVQPGGVIIFADWDEKEELWDATHAVYVWTGEGPNAYTASNCADVLNVHPSYWGDFGRAYIFYPRQSKIGVSNDDDISKDKIDKSTNELIWIYPNPFNLETRINYRVSKNYNVYIKIYDILGREICYLVNEKKQPGLYSTIWNGKNNSGREFNSGIYFIRISIGNYSVVSKIMLIK